MSEHEDHLPKYRVRPRFKVETPEEIGQVIGKIKSGLENENATCTGSVHPRFVTLRLPVDQQHYWSPQLTVNFEERHEGGALIRGLYGPRPTVWTMFVFFYSIIGLAVLVIGTLGFSAWSLGKPSTILWLVPVLLVVFLTLYLVAYFGQKVGHNQMEVLHEFFEESTGISTIEETE